MGGWDGARARRCVGVSLVWSIVVLPSSTLAAQEASIGEGESGGARTASRARDPLEWTPSRVETAPTIDGVLDEPVWDRVQELTGFRTFEPDYGSEMLADTRVLMAYDDSNLYFAFEAHDPDPEQIRASVTSRDNMFRDDWVAINLDSFGDAQSLYGFYVNPLGIQGDSRFAAGTEDRGVDLVWYSAGRVHERGYTVEVRIPLLSIRFRDADPVRMGVIFERRISRNSQFGTVPELDPARAGQWLNQMHPMSYEGLTNPTLFELLPAVTYSLDKSQTEGRLATETDRGDLSLTAKLGLTSDLVLDGTYNPDFSQVEADAGQVDVNLRSAIFYPEKRPFFLEGREHFGFAATGGANPLRSVVYTRRIVDPVTGGRLSGKIGADHTVASIFAVDELEGGVDGASDQAYVPVVRYKHALNEDSFVGGLYAGRMTEARENHTAGLDALLRVGESTELGFHGVASRTLDDQAGEEARVGHSLAARLASSTRRLDWSLDVLSLSERFATDIGFVDRGGLVRGVGMVRGRFFPAVPHVRRVDVELQQGQTYDRPGELWETSTRLSVANHVLGSLNVRGWVQRASEVFLGERFENDGYEVTVGGLISSKGAFGVSYGSQSQPIYQADPYQGRSRSFSALVGLQPTPNLDSEISFNTVDYHRSSDSEKVLDFTLLRIRTTVQANRYLFFRVIGEYDWYREDFLTDLLASFTYIPGTVMHVGHGSLYERTRWDGSGYVPGDRLREVKRRFFFKTSYLFRN